ncbi:hypothetical protein [Pseudomonas knackmussii]|uniref:hypothetical protein n=1 Tax=Pseudomonas knackmussii TaxID=65741 RepID=UPI001362507D|nr:hypothetical protein [Pseudomonas knackmussii]
MPRDFRTFEATAVSLGLGLLATQYTSFLHWLPLDTGWRLALAALPLIVAGTVIGRYLAAHPELG